jgi:hypothetical protein
MDTIPSEFTCDTPKTISDEIINDTYGVFSNEMILDMWKHYRLTDATVRKVYGDPPAELKNDGVLMSTPHYDDLYKTVFKPFFAQLTGVTDEEVATNRQLIVVSSKIEDPIIIIHKQDWQFWSGQFNIPAALRQEFTDQFNYLARNNNIKQRLIEVSVSECGQRSTPMEKLARLTVSK